MKRLIIDLNSKTCHRYFRFLALGPCLHVWLALRKKLWLDWKGVFLEMCELIYIIPSVISSSISSSSEGEHNSNNSRASFAAKFRFSATDIIFGANCRRFCLMQSAAFSSANSRLYSFRNYVRKVEKVV